MDGLIEMQGLAGGHESSYPPPLSISHADLEPPPPPNSMPRPSSTRGRSLPSLTRPLPWLQRDTSPSPITVSPIQKPHHAPHPLQPPHSPLPYILPPLRRPASPLTHPPPSPLTHSSASDLTSCFFSSTPSPSLHSRSKLTSQRAASDGDAAADGAARHMRSSQGLYDGAGGSGGAAIAISGATTAGSGDAVAAGGHVVGEHKRKVLALIAARRGVEVGGVMKRQLQ